MARRAAALRLMRGLPALAALGVGCEILIDGELDSVLCSQNGAVGPPACPDEFVCSDGACIGIDSRDRELGRPCARDSDCGAEDFCLDPVLFGGVGPHVCARSCCTSSDCDPVEKAVCWIPDRGGGGFCRPGVAVGRPDVGTRLPGERCSGRGDCRSGICVEGACIDACCSDTNCAATGASCRLTTQLVSAGSAWACQPAEPQKLGYFERCREDVDCASGICASLEGITRCTIPCCSSGMCPVSSSGQTGYNVGCTELTTRDGSIVRACAELRPEQAIGDIGVRCTVDDECRGGMCVRQTGATNGFCSDVCCTEASCGDPSLFGCRPYAADPSWALRCAPK
jgi:hypothetical protein